jgi:hypothetical protein
MEQFRNFELHANYDKRVELIKDMFWVWNFSKGLGVSK